MNNSNIIIFKCVLMILRRFLSRLPTQAAGLHPSVTSVSAWCDSAPGLVKRQRALCRQSPSVMLVLVDSGRLSLRECQHHFRTERWNCSALNDDNTGLSKFMKQGWLTKSHNK